MPKTDYRRYTLTQRQFCRDLFLDTLQSLECSAPARIFLSDILTESELVMFARRIAIANRLLRGWSIDRIIDHLHAGIRNIIAVDRWLEGKLPGYRQCSSPEKDLTEERIREELLKNYPQTLPLIAAIFPPKQNS